MGATFLAKIVQQNCGAIQVQNNYCHSHEPFIGEWLMIVTFLNFLFSL